ncbi:MAG: MBL fold metallo-hydrolase RNA specificity domain-containing protein [Candidatus Micrarchaeota archaeon]
MTIIKFLGAAKEVGRSAIEVKSNKNYLLDCGIKLNKGSEEFPLLDAKEIRKLDDVIITHAHLDHSGYAPALYKHGYQKKVSMTKPTRDLIQLLLSDYLRINRDRNKAYTQKDLDKLLTNISIKEYGNNKDYSLHDAGHILGSAMVLLKNEKILYTGDFNNRSTRLLEGAEQGISAETLIIESTYGAKTDHHVPIKELSNTFIKSIATTLRHGGKVIIPTFAIGRGQEILFTLENYLRTKQLENVPVFLDGMVIKCLKIYRHNAIYLKDEVKHRILTSDDDPFKSDYYTIPQKKDRSDVFESGPCIIVSTSGMLNGGPVLEYLKKLGSNKKNKLILVGFQAEGTNGRAILEGAKEINIRGEKYELNLQVEQNSFSGHADYQGLNAFVKGIKGLKRVFIVHGEKEKTSEFAEGLREKNKKLDVIVPDLGEEFKVL